MHEHAGRSRRNGAHAQRLGGGAGMSSERFSREPGSGVAVMRGGNPSGTTSIRSSAPEGIARTTANATSAAPPLQVSALAHGSERGPRVREPGEHARSALPEEQHDAAVRSTGAASDRTRETPAASDALRRTTHAPQVALPGRIAFAAAIHSASEKRTPIGGRTPRSRAHTRRWCGVWQQHAVQHSMAPAQPQPQSSQGYAAMDPIDAPHSRPSSRPSVAGDGIAPIDAMATTATMATATKRCQHADGLQLEQCNMEGTATRKGCRV